MLIQELVWTEGKWKETKGESPEPSSVQLILLFGDVSELENLEHLHYFQGRYPHAHVVGASTAGTIESGTLSEHSAVATLIGFERGWVEVACVNHLDNETLEKQSKELIEQLPQENLRHVFVLMDGMKLNGSLLVKGINSGDKKLSVTGGLAGDQFTFERTLVLANAAAQERQAVAIGFYGDSLHISVGCETGWEEFGAERVVTRSEGNVVYEIDNKPALKLYEDYLGEFIKDLPFSGLRFPLNVRQYSGDKEVVRVMMGINEDQSLWFAGDVPQGSIVRLMKTNVNNLVQGADLVAGLIDQYNDKPSLALTVSCSGRRSVLKQMVDEELSAVQERLGKQTHLCGFYSFGELSPFSDDLLNCKLHNQTMTLTVIYED
ncbi:MAG TPA: FIST N-terminal domain-containing protein [Sulfuricurvum sp.]|nr:FIST N-terminal domain-containing protein [Sulfuricurvum sp.]